MILCAYSWTVFVWLNLLASRGKHKLRYKTLYCCLSVCFSSLPLTSSCVSCHASGFEYSQHCSCWCLFLLCTFLPYFIRLSCFFNIRNVPGYILFEKKKHTVLIFIKHWFCFFRVRLYDGHGIWEIAFILLSIHLFCYPKCLKAFNVEFNITKTFIFLKTYTYAPIGIQLNCVVPCYWKLLPPQANCSKQCKAFVLYLCTEVCTHHSLQNCQYIVCVFCMPHRLIQI